MNGWVDGDVLILNNGQDDIDYICIVSREYGYDHTLRIGQDKLKCDASWPNPGFSVGQIVMRLNDATIKYNEYLSNFKPSIAGLSPNARQLFRQETYDIWVLQFLIEEGQRYKDTYIEHEE